MSQGRFHAEETGLICGGCRQRPLYCPTDSLGGPEARVVHHVKRPTFVWKSRLKSILET
jgi:hypothetical protein